MNAKEYMQSIRQIRREVNLLFEQIERDRALAAGVKAIRYDIDKVQTSPEDRLSEIVAGIVENEKKLVVRIHELQEKENEIREILLCLREEHERVLVLHYIDGLLWDAVAEKLSYNERYIYELRDKALDELDAYLEELNQTE